MGDNFITIVRDAEYVIGGIVTGKTAIAYSIWVIGALIIVTSLILLFSDQEDEHSHLARMSGFFIMGSGALFLFSCIVQYGLLFYGSSGLSIPFGVPLVIFIGYLFYADFPGTAQNGVNRINSESVILSTRTIEEET
ncbi:hypothetical protein FGU65_01350 [Methanoculleus sp. FWC-SCC1]|uniref:Uncharacterized protein n=1 Tax=Methanoculleus frigidifontis TaxID=2584085 RepID=A0ABT8M6L9_9EURY|nr:hypothetical protein [Methanoculleus sp. FWC-SCC1]MDN7023556.1 hypothetical protein [Methanoculleus sp. FWC-SCC1]